MVNTRLESGPEPDNLSESSTVMPSTREQLGALSDEVFMSGLTDLNSKLQVLQGLFEENRVPRQHRDYFRRVVSSRANIVGDLLSGQIDSANMTEHSLIRLRTEILALKQAINYAPDMLTTVFNRRRISAYETSLREIQSQIDVVNVNIGAALQNGLFSDARSSELETVASVPTVAPEVSPVPAPVPTPTRVERPTPAPTPRATPTPVPRATPTPAPRSVEITERLSLSEQQVRVNRLNNASRLTQSLVSSSVLPHEPDAGLSFPRLDRAESATINVPSGTIVKFQRGTVISINLTNQRHRNFATGLSLHVQPNSSSREARTSRRLNTGTIQEDAYVIVDRPLTIPAGITITGGMFGYLA